MSIVASAHPISALGSTNPLIVLRDNVQSEILACNFSACTRFLFSGCALYLFCLVSHLLLHNRLCSALPRDATGQVKVWNLASHRAVTSFTPHTGGRYRSFLSSRRER